MALNFKEMIDKAGLTDEQKKAAAELFGVDSLTKLIEEDALHQANEAFVADKTKLQANWDRANTEFLKMQERVTNYDATEKELTDARKALADATEKLKTANPNIDLDKLTKDITEVVRGEARTLEMGRGAIELDALECVSAHRDLFGQQLSVRQLVQDALAAKKPVVAYWEEKYNVPAKRTEVAAAAHNKELSDAEERGYKKRIGEEANPATRALSPSKDPFWVPKPATTEAMQPWEATEAPAEETVLLNELQAARG